MAQLKPNEFGLFDMLRNAWESVQDPYAGIHHGGVDQTTLQQDRHLVTLDGEKTRKGFEQALQIFGRGGFGRMKRGGSFQEKVQGVRPARRVYWTAHRFDIGFRVARTVD